MPAPKLNKAPLYKAARSHLGDACGQHGGKWLHPCVTTGVWLQRCHVPRWALQGQGRTGVCQSVLPWHSHPPVPVSGRRSPCPAPAAVGCSERPSVPPRWRTLRPPLSLGRKVRGVWQAPAARCAPILHPRTPPQPCTPPCTPPPCTPSCAPQQCSPPLLLPAAAAEPLLWQAGKWWPAGAGSVAGKSWFGNVSHFRSTPQKKKKKKRFGVIKMSHS